MRGWPQGALIKVFADLPPACVVFSWSNYREPSMRLSHTLIRLQEAPLIMIIFWQPAQVAQGGLSTLLNTLLPYAYAHAGTLP